MKLPSTIDRYTLRVEQRVGVDPLFQKPEFLEVFQRFGLSTRVSSSGFYVSKPLKQSELKLAIEQLTHVGVLPAFFHLIEDALEEPLLRFREAFAITTAPSNIDRSYTFEVVARKVQFKDGWRVCRVVVCTSRELLLTTQLEMYYSCAKDLVFHEITRAQASWLLSKWSGELVTLKDLGIHE